VNSPKRIDTQNLEALIHRGYESGLPGLKFPSFVRANADFAEQAKVFVFDWCGHRGVWALLLPFFSIFSECTLLKRREENSNNRERAHRKLSHSSQPLSDHHIARAQLTDRPSMAGVDIPNPKKLSNVPKNVAKLVLIRRGCTLVNNRVPFLNAFFQHLKSRRGWLYLPAFGFCTWGKAQANTSHKRGDAFPQFFAYWRRTWGGRKEN
jgi:hypothetical protein